MKAIKEARQVTSNSETPSTYHFSVDMFNGLEIKNGEIVLIYEGDHRVGGSYTPLDLDFETECKYMIKKIYFHSAADIRKIYHILSPGRMKILCEKILEIEEF